MPRRMTGDGNETFQKVGEKDRLFFVLSTILAIGLFFLMLKAGGYLKWALGIFVIVIMAILAVVSMVHRTRRSFIWKDERGFSENLNSDVKRTSTLIKRALDGQKISRGLLERRLKKICLRKIKREKDLSDEELKSILKSPKKLEKLVEDPLVVELLYDESRSYEEKDSVNFSHDMTYEEKLKKLINLAEEEEICS